MTTPSLTNELPIVLTPKQRIIAMLRCNGAWFDYQRMLLHKRFPELLGKQARSNYLGVDMNETFRYAPIYNQPGNFEVLFKPSRKVDWANPNNTPWRRFALCTNETDATTLCSAMNKWDADGNDWVREISSSDNKHLCA